MKRYAIWNKRDPVITPVGEVLTAQQYYKIPLYSSNVLSVARTDRFTGYVVSDGQTVFNNETLKNLVQVTGE